MTPQMTAEPSNLETPERQFANRISGLVVVTALYSVAVLAVRLAMH